MDRQEKIELCLDIENQLKQSNLGFGNRHKNDFCLYLRQSDLEEYQWWKKAREVVEAVTRIDINAQIEPDAQSGLLWIKIRNVYN